jgi:hypothetical protein
MEELIKQDKKYIIQILGKEYALPPISWGILYLIEEKFGCNIVDLIPLLQKSLYKNSLDLVLILLQDSHPEITKETLNKVTDNKEISLVIKSISELLMDFFGDN